jgi:hypothetical protein
MVDTLRALGDYAADRGLALGIERMQPESLRDYVDGAPRRKSSVAAAACPVRRFMANDR